MSSTWAVVRQAAADFIDDDALTLGAALAYYTALAMSPLVVLLLWLAAFAGPGIQEQLVSRRRDEALFPRRLTERPISDLPHPCALL